MKKLLFLALSLMMSVITFAQDNDLAMVQRTQGILVFTDCEPICKYEVLSIEKKFFALNPSYSNIKEKLIKRALKDFPEADGVVLEMSNHCSDNALIIKFVKDPNVPSSDYPKARVIKNNGLYIFAECEPIQKYEVIDREKVLMTWSGQYSEVRDKLVRKTIRHNPDAHGVILGSTIHCVIKFE